MLSYDYFSSDLMEDFEYLLKKCELSLESEDYESVIEYCDNLLTIDSNNIDVLLYKSYSLHCLHKYEESLVIYNKLLKLKPDEGSFWCSKGYLLENLGEYDMAIECFNNAYNAQTAPHKLDMIYSLAFLFKKLGRFAEAKKEWELIIEALISEYETPKDDNTIEWAKREIVQLEQLMATK